MQQECENLSNTKKQAYLEEEANLKKEAIKTVEKFTVPKKSITPMKSSDSLQQSKLSLSGERISLPPPSNISPS